MAQLDAHRPAHHYQIRLDVSGKGSVSVEVDGRA